MFAFLFYVYVAIYALCVDRLVHVEVWVMIKVLISLKHSFVSIRHYMCEQANMQSISAILMLRDKLHVHKYYTNITPAQIIASS